MAPAAALAGVPGCRDGHQGLGAVARTVAVATARTTARTIARTTARTTARIIARTIARTIAIAVTAGLAGDHAARLATGVARLGRGSHVQRALVDAVPERGVFVGGGRRTFVLVVVRVVGRLAVLVVAILIALGSAIVATAVL